MNFAEINLANGFAVGGIFKIVFKQMKILMINFVN